MAQLWLTYLEVAEAFGGNPSQAREVAVEQGWPRKHSSDGSTRILMPPSLMTTYFVKEARRIDRLERQANEMVGEMQLAFFCESTRHNVPRDLGELTILKRSA